MPAGHVNKKTCVFRLSDTRNYLGSGKNSFYAAHKFKLRGIFHFHLYLLTGISDPVRWGLHHCESKLVFYYFLPEDFGYKINAHQS